MSEVKRIGATWNDICESMQLRESPNGEYVAYEDYAALKQRAEAAEAKQEPAAWLNTRQGDPSWPRVFVTEEKAAANRKWVTLAPMVKTQPLFTRPAPAADPAEMVPSDKTITAYFDTLALDTAREIMCDVNRRSELLGGDVQLLSRIQCRIDEACRAAILRNIEEKSK